MITGACEMTCFGFNTALDILQFTQASSMYAHKESIYSIGEQNLPALQLRLNLVSIII